MRVLAAMAITALLAGCYEAPREDPLEPRPAATSDETSPLPMPPPSFNPPNEFSLDDCTSVAMGFTWPASFGPGNAPHGWEYDAGETLGTLELVKLLSCNRMSLGGFERPVTLLMEAHSKATPPPNCQSESQITLVLHAIWFSDSELANAWEDHFLFPASVAEFSDAVEPSPLHTKITWTWTLEGRDSGAEIVVPLSEPQDLPLEVTYRLAWPTPRGVSILTLNETAHVPTSIEQMFVGDFRPPMLHAETGIETITERADYFMTANSIGQVESFGDYACTSPS